MNYTGCNQNRAFFSSRACGAICFLGFLFALALGLILGAVFSTTLLPALAALIVFAAVILAVIIALLIYQFRRTD